MLTGLHVTVSLVGVPFPRALMLRASGQLLLRHAWRSQSSVSLALAKQAADHSHYSTECADEVKWVFLGPPGVGKGTYASRVAQALGVPHIAAGDLVRAEIKSGSSLGQEVRYIHCSNGVMQSFHNCLRDQHQGWTRCLIHGSKCKLLTLLYWLKDAAHCQGRSSPAG